MTYDFRANQVRLNRIISSGSIPILIYPSSSATNFQGGKTFPDPGSDVFLFVSGSSTAKTVFGGDAVVSSSLKVLGPITASIISGSKTDIPALQQNRPNSGSLLIPTSVVVSESLMLFDGPSFNMPAEAGGIALANGAGLSLWAGPVGYVGSPQGPVFSALPDISSDVGIVQVLGTFYIQSGSSLGGTDVFTVAQGTTPSTADVILTGSLQVRGGITGSISGTIGNLPFIAAGSNITTKYNSLGQWEITSSGGGGNLWTEGTSTFIYTTSSVGIKTAVDHSNVDLFISGSDTTGNGANLVLYNDLSGFGLPRLILSSSSGSLGGLIGYDDDVNGLVDGINIDIPSTRNFGFRIGGGTTATTIDSAGNLNVRNGSQSTAYFDVGNRIVGIGVTPPNLASTYTNATRLVLKDTDNTGKYQLFLSNEYSGTDLNSGIAFAFGASNISGAIYAKSNTTGYDRKGLNALMPTGNSFSWRTTGAHLGELTDSGNLIISGSVKAYTGFTGSLSGTIGGLPFIIGGPNITANYNALGQWALTGSSGGGDVYWTSTVSNAIFTTGSAAATILYASNGASITGSLTQGFAVNASGQYSHAQGNGPTASGPYSHAEGTSTTASGQSSHAEGQTTSATAYNAHSEGYNTVASGNHSHAEGEATTASGERSHAEGNASQAIGEGSHAEGYQTIARGNYSHAQGIETVTAAAASYSQVGGVATVASGSGQTVFGKYNKRGNTPSLFVVGDGSGDSDALRHDILRVESGSVQVTGSLIATGITGSISGTVGGLPFIVAGSNVTASYNNGSGQWTISANAGGSGGSTSPGGLDQQIQFNSGSTFSGSSNLTYNYNTNVLTLTGSLTASTVVAGGVNITPTTASLVIGGDGVNRASGSISGLFESGSLMTAGTIGKFDIEILAMDYNTQTGASWKYTATALWPYSGNFSFLAATELAAEYGPAAGSYNPATEWDVNFNSLGQIELTGSAPAFPSGGTSFYVQVTKKMVASYGTIIA